MQVFDLELLLLLTSSGREFSSCILITTLFGLMGWVLFIGLAISKRARQGKVVEEVMENPATASCREEEGWLVQFRGIVDRRLHEFDLKAEDLARELGMSRTHFFQQVKQETGKTPTQFLQDARFERARHLLETGGVDTVKAAAISVGFRNGKYFSRVFRERFGTWPSDYLKK